MNLLVILEGNYVLLLMLSQKRMFFRTIMSNGLLKQT
jgi:hypothetical protein